jgi:curved DNA-binding protein CbpA
MRSSGDTEFIDYYDLLGLEPDADISEIRNAFIQKAKKHHPDAGGSTEMMQLMNTAYKTLTSGTAKAAYDIVHSFHTGTSEVADYKYDGGRNVQGVEDMSDDEIDSFLDSMLAEFRDGVPKPKQTVKGRFKKLLDL